MYIYIYIYIYLYNITARLPSTLCRRTVRVCMTRQPTRLHNQEARVKRFGDLPELYL